jgi:hypothetical protein
MDEPIEVAREVTNLVTSVEELIEDALVRGRERLEELLAVGQLLTVDEGGALGHRLRNQLPQGVLEVSLK